MLVKAQTQVYSVAKVYKLLQGVLVDHESHKLLHLPVVGPSRTRAVGHTHEYQTHLKTPFTLATLLALQNIHLI